jgi:hypothetical protein
MALAFRITKTAYEKLADDIKSHYEADGDKHYALEVTGLEDNGALKRAKERAEEEAVDLKTELKEAQKELKTLKDAGGEGGQDVARLTRSHERKIASLTEKHTERETKLQAFIKKNLVESKAEALAKEISTVPALMTKHLMERMDALFDGDEPALVIMGKDGKPDPAMTVDKLKAEVLANAEFKPILIANKATGSAAQSGAMPAKGATPAKVDAGGNTAEVDVNALPNDAFFARVKAKREAAAAQQQGGAQ